MCFFFKLPEIQKKYRVTEVALHIIYKSHIQVYYTLVFSAGKGKTFFMAIGRSFFGGEREQILRFNILHFTAKFCCERGKLNFTCVWCFIFKQFFVGNGRRFYHKTPLNFSLFCLFCAVSPQNRNLLLAFYRNEKYVVFSLPTQYMQYFVYESSKGHGKA